MRKNWIMAAGLCLFIATAGIGCGAKGEEPQGVSVEQEPLEDGSGQSQEDDTIQGEETKADEQSKDSESVSEPGSGKTEQLDGNVRGIGDNGIVIIKTRNEETEEDGVFLAVAPAPGNETEEDYVDVNFADDVKFECHVVKNGGVNPDEDVTVKEASFSDIKGDMSVTLEGYYDGDIFIAEKVVLYEFV